MFCVAVSVLAGSPRAPALLVVMSPVTAPVAVAPAAPKWPGAFAFAFAFAFALTIAFVFVFAFAVWLVLALELPSPSASANGCGVGLRLISPGCSEL